MVVRFGLPNGHGFNVQYEKGLDEKFSAYCIVRKDSNRNFDIQMVYYCLEDMIFHRVFDTWSSGLGHRFIVITMA